MAVAAAVILAVAGAAAWMVTRQPFAQNPTARLAALAPRDARVIEPRLSGGFDWAPYRGPLRASDTAPDARALRLSGVTGELLERADADPAAEAQQAAGAALLLVDRPHDAVARLRIAAQRQPSSSVVWNDLGAAEYAAAQRNNQPSRYSEALAALDRALSLEPDRAEALFNRALTLERLGLRAAAREAWERYLRVDATSAWANEAREHLQRLPAVTGESRFRLDQPRLEAAATKGDTSAVTFLVQQYPQASRSYAEAEYLGQWGEAVQRGDAAAAARALVIARTIAEALRRTTGETLLHDAIAVIDRADVETRRILADAHATYRRGRIVYSRQAPAAAEPELRRAARLFQAAGSPMALAARYFAANTRFDQNDVTGARGELRSLLIEADAHPRYQALGAQVRWELALCLMNDDDWGGALPLLEESERMFAALGERSNRGFVETLIADALVCLGRPDDAWAARIRSFDVLSAEGWGDRLAVSIGGAVRMDLRSGRLTAARALSALELDALRTAGNGVSLANALVRAAILNVELGDGDAAAANARDAANVASRLADPAMRTRALADVEFANGAVLVRRDPRAAAASLDRAIAAYARVEAPLFLPESHLLRARAALRLGERATAMRELSRGIAAYERHRVRYAESVVGTGVLNAGAALYHEAIRLALDGGDTAAAFAWSERSLRQLAPAAEPVQDELRALEARLAGTATAVLELAMMPEEVVAFAVTARGTTVGRSRLGERDPVALGEAARKGDVTAAGELYDLFIRPVAPALGDAAQLIVVPDPRLETIPFAALLDAGTGLRLIERLPVAVTPTAASLRRDTWPLPRTIAAVGVAHADDARAALPASDEELAELAQLYPHAIDAADRTPTFAALVDAAARADVIHISGHSDRHGRSGETALAFRAAEGGGTERVTWRRIASAPLRHSPVVVLAACETLRAPRLPQRRTLSLGNGFLAAGAGDIIGTLAPIPDNDARVLFRRIHRHLAAGHNAAEALRLAQLESLAAEKNGRADVAWRSVALLTRRIVISQRATS